MSISTAHSDAARQNGSLSNGPVTAEGKARSSQNARKHNIFTSVGLLPIEDRAAFQSLLEQFVEEHRPTTPTECRYVREMADAEFRLIRIREYSAMLQWREILKLEDSPAPAAEGFEKLMDNNKLALMMRYERMAQRQFEEAIRGLLQLRKQAAAAQTTALKNDLSLRMNALEKLVLGYGEEAAAQYPEPAPTQPPNQPSPQPAPALQKEPMPDLASTIASMLRQDS